MGKKFYRCRNRTGQYLHKTTYIRGGQQAQPLSLLCDLRALDHRKRSDSACLFTILTVYIGKCDLKLYTRGERE